MPHKGFRSIHSGGYDELTASKVKAVAVPDKISCMVCKKWKANSQYSNKQLADYRFKMLQSGNPKSNGSVGVKCRICTGQQVTELTCSICDDVKPLIEFGKNHRRDPDNARCIKCIEIQAGLEPGLEDVPSDHESEPSNYWDETEEGSIISSDGGAPIAVHHTGLNSISLAKHDSVVGGCENFRPSIGEPSTTPSEVDSALDSQISAWNKFSIDSDRQSTAEDGHVWVAQPRYKQAAYTAYTGYDSTGVGHSRHRAPSTATTQSFAEIKSSRVQSYSGNRDKFPKPSRKSSAPTPYAEMPEYAKKDRGYHLPDEDDDDDDDDGYYLG
ncbi:hypothetical protein MMC30_003492 [Trapelia coarctata]|nr:hypothetical protein [Trapelia coarctata]